MTGSSREALETIARLTEAAFAARQARMGALKREEADLRARLAELSAGRHKGADGPLDDNPAMRAGADLLWQTWCDNRRSTLNQILARNLVAQSRERAELTRTFGRSRAASQLRDEAEKRAAAERLARDDRLTEGPD